MSQEHQPHTLLAPPAACRHPPPTQLQPHTHASGAVTGETGGSSGCQVKAASTHPPPTTTHPQYTLTGRRIAPFFTGPVTRAMKVSSRLLLSGWPLQGQGKAGQCGLGRYRNRTGL